MKALVKYARGPGNLELQEVPEPVPAVNQVKLEVAWCGICGTDLHVWNDTFRNYPPVILGHEFCGRVVEAGAAVAGIPTGARFAILGASAVTCGQCAYCRAGEFMFCAQRRGMGHGVNGAFARYACARPDQLFALPAHLPDDEGALCEPLAAAVHAVCEQTTLRVGDVALVSGPGPMGLLCLKLLVLQGFKTIVAGAAADGLRLEIARRLGAAAVVNVEGQDLLTVVREETGGLGADAALECAGTAGSVQNCLRALRPFGRYTQVGHFGEPIGVDLDLLALRQLQVVGSVGYNAGSWVRMLTILAQGRVRLGELITHRLPLAQWREGFAACQDKLAVKVLLQP
jgi:L-iditol 2-dehydrogenase